MTRKGEPDSGCIPGNGKLRGMRQGLTRYGDDAFSLYLRKVFIKAMGYTDDALDRPLIGITNTFSGYNACHANAPRLIEAVKRGVMLEGALPVEFPIISVHESFSYPTSMFLRNLMSIDAEEMIRAQPMDAVVLIGGCDKTVPALLMGAASAGVPAIMEVTGPMLAGGHKGERIGACTDCRRFWAKFRAGEIAQEDMEQVSGRLAPSAGTCGVMGTASTMALMTEALGMMLPGGAAIPAVMADRMRHAEKTGRQAVKLAHWGMTPDKVMTEAAFHNAVRTLLAVGGSTNGVVHLTAMAGRLGVNLPLDIWDEMGRETPVLVDLKPSGEHYMEDLWKAGGLTPILRRLQDQLHLTARTVTGKTLGENLGEQEPDWPQTAVRNRDNPIHSGGSIAVLKGSLAPNGAILKQSAASPDLLNHEGRAVVFDNLEDLANRIDADDLDVNAHDILVLRNIGPKGAPGMPEAGYIPIPKKLAAQGVKDMVRISDGRMSGTAFGTVILHVSPESAIGGPLALVQTGDRIKLSANSRTIDLLLDDAEFARRKTLWEPPPAHEGSDRGYLKLHLDSVLQAEDGADFGFLRSNT